jgi:nucleotide-binding universal stress UspA family protein
MSTTIICTDGSDGATKAATIGVSLLRRTDRCVIATVVSEPDASLVLGDSGFAGGTMSEEEFTELNDRVQAEGEEVVRSLAGTLDIQPIETVVLQGKAGDALCTFATDASATVMVAGSRGRGGLKRAVLGSVSDHLVRHAPCPVLVVGA